MRKIIMLVLLTVLLASAMPGTELMKLEVINKSEYDAYLILQDVEFKYNPVRPTIYKAGENLPKVQFLLTASVRVDETALSELAGAQSADPAYGTTIRDMINRRQNRQ